MVLDCQSDCRFHPVETVVKYSYENQLVLQLPGSSLRDYDELIQLEAILSTGLGNLGEVDGHDMGVGEMNIFIHTDHPKLAFEKVKALLGTKDFMPDLKAGYRSFNEDDYTVLYPPDLSHFDVA